MYKIDLHTHSQASSDGGISLNQYENIIKLGKLDFMAITDHNRIDFAIEANKKLGSKIIVGEEIMSSEGEIIGLFLNDTIAPYQTAQKTINDIKKQSGIVYIPHPLETARKGLSLDVMNKVFDDIGIVEVFNSRAFQRSLARKADIWAQEKNIVRSAASDAHGKIGLGRTYTIIKEPPTRDNLLEQLSDGKLICKDIGMTGRLYPTINRVRKKARYT